MPCAEIWIWIKTAWFVRHLGEILCHNGEFELKEYRPVKNLTFEKYDSNVEECYVEGGEAIKNLFRQP